MSDFLCHFAAPQSRIGPEGRLDAFATFLDRYLGSAERVKIRVEGAEVLLRVGAGIRWVQVGQSWVVVRGRIYHIDGAEPEVDLEAWLNNLVRSGAPGDFRRFEGSFACCLWDGERRRGWFVNDQASTLSQYYGECVGGVLVGSQAVGLAHVIGAGLSAPGLRELLVRGVTTAPLTVFDGVSRLNVGEHGCYANGRLEIRRHWHAYAEPRPFRSSQEAAEASASIFSDRMRRLAAVGGPMLIDLTGGLDSRLLGATADFARIPFEVTVNGLPDEPDVRFAEKVAGAVGWRLNHFNTGDLWTVPVDEDLLACLTVATNGDMSFSAIYHHWLTRPNLARRFGTHANGSGGGLLRYHPWGQEFLGIGRRRRANVDNVIRFRAMHSGLPPDWLYDSQWYPLFLREFKNKIEIIVDEGPGTLTTQQLDAIHVWKMTGHAALWVSSTFGWMPACSPMLMAGYIENGISMPWRMRLRSSLQRRVIATLCPAAAAVGTLYGGNARPADLRNAYWEIRQLAGRGLHLARKIRDVSGSRLGRRPTTAGQMTAVVPWVTPATRRVLAPSTMLTAPLYRRSGLEKIAEAADDTWHAQSVLITRILTVECLARLLDHAPAPDLLDRT